MNGSLLQIGSARVCIPQSLACVLLGRDERVRPEGIHHVVQRNAVGQGPGNELTIIDPHVMRPLGLPGSALNFSGSCVITARHMTRTCSPTVNQYVIWVLNHATHKDGRPVLNLSRSFPLWVRTRPVGT